MKKKIETINFNSINGSRLTEAINIPVYYDSYFFCYIPEVLSGIIDEAHLRHRYEGRGKSTTMTQVIVGKTPGEIKTILWTAYEVYYSNSIIEEKIIVYVLKYNSTAVYENHASALSDHITTGLGINFKIRYKITFPDGKQKIFSHPYKGYGTIVSQSFATDIEKFKDKWIDWTPEREAFFKQTVDALESMISKVQQFFNADQETISLLIDSKSSLLLNNTTQQ